MPNNLLSMILIHGAVLLGSVFIIMPGPSSVSEVNAKLIVPCESQTFASSVRRPAQIQQSKFSLEEKMKHPVEVPDSILQILKHDIRNQEILANGQLASEMSISWFAASEIHLNQDGLPDLIVIATEPRLFGANVIPFWVFQATSHKYKLILSVSALNLEICSASTNGVRDISTSVTTAREAFTTIFKFNGMEYIVDH